MMYKKEDFRCYDSMYYVGDVWDVDGDGWVDEEGLDYIIQELNKEEETKLIPHSGTSKV